METPARRTDAFVNLLTRLRTARTEGAAGLAGPDTFSQGASSAPEQARRNKPGTELGPSAARASHQRPQPRHSASPAPTPQVRPDFCPVPPSPQVKLPCPSSATQLGPRPRAVPAPPHRQRRAGAAPPAAAGPGPGPQLPPG